MRKVYVILTTKLVITADDKVSIEDVVNELDYSFVSTDDSAEVDDTEILDWYIDDSK